jgi:hypothetical protein
MGRSVSTPTHAIAVYDRLENSDWECWEDFQYEFQTAVCSMYPSVRKWAGWIDRENKVLAGNAHAFFGVSSYCGLVAMWVVPRTNTVNDWGEPVGLAANWVDQIAPGFIERFGTMVKDGQMSNGQGVYRAKTAYADPVEDLAGDEGHVVVNGLLCG